MSKGERRSMKLGAFSISLNVKDIHKSKEFYSKLGFEAFGGDINQNWLIMKNDNCIIGLFQGMFEKNMLTFNPGWDENAQNLESFTDIRDIQKTLQEKGIQITSGVIENSEGPAHVMIEDPDGNPILLNQHR
jgi:lactoylglutathione lyase